MVRQFLNTTLLQKVLHGREHRRIAYHLISQHNCLKASNKKLPFKISLSCLIFSINMSPNPARIYRHSSVNTVLSNPSAAISPGNDSRQHPAPAVFDS